MGFIYFDTAHAIHVHDEIIKHSGGRMGVVNLALLESVIEHIQNDLYYPKIEDKLTHLFHSVNKNHSFVDGNKRASIALSAYFMEINGLSLCVAKFISEMENIAVDVADNRIDKPLLFEIIRSTIHEDDHNDALKLEIIRAKEA